MGWQESLLYFIPLIFFITQSVLVAIFRGKDDFILSIIIGILVIPFATAFYFLVTSIIFFTIFALISFLFAILAISAYGADRDKLGTFFMVINAIIIIIEYLFLLNG